MGLSFKQWLENSGPPGGLHPPLQRPDKMQPGAFATYNLPGEGPGGDETFSVVKLQKRKSLRKRMKKK